MSQAQAPDATQGVADNFTSTAKDYDAAVRHNVNGASRLIMSVPPGDYRRVLDVGCGTGWAALSLLERFPGVEHVTGIDPAEGMLEVFREKAAAISGVEFDIRAADVMDMGVEAGSQDLVISSMAMHWFPDKPGAAAAMAATLRPGGAIAILCSGRRGEHEFREVLRAMDPPPPAAWDAAFDAVQRDEREMEEYLVGAGLEPLDVWMESRVRRSTVEAYLERMRVVASHISSGSLSEDEVADLMERVGAGMAAVSGPRGFEYTFTKLYAVARKPE
jgi:ubiquinone/menaquinone biosynthesis C-methylase UbiE